MECPAGGSLPLDVCRLDDRPPFLDLGLLQRPERLRRLLVPRENLKPDICKERADVRIGQRIQYRGSELRDERSRPVEPATVADRARCIPSKSRYD
jgi:hypothetical protein